MKHILLTLSVLFMLSLPVNAEVLASVGDETLTYEELIEMIGGEENLLYLGITTEGDATAILDSWISEELLIQSAESAGLESEPFVAAAIEDARRQILLEAYLMQITQDIEQPSSLEMINYAGTWEDTYCKEINANVIVVQDEILANSLRTQITSSEDFAELSLIYGGEVGWITRGQIGSMQFDEAAFRLDTGEISGVIEIDGSYYIIEITGVEEISPTPTSENILYLVEQELIRLRQEDILFELLDELKAEHNIQIYPERLMGHL